jgi:hypothetical protein
MKNRRNVEGMTMPAGAIVVLSLIIGLGSYVGLYFSPRNNLFEGMLAAACIVGGLALIRLLIAAVIGAARSR